MNNAEFVKEARARQQWADEMPEDLESLLAAWASVDLDLTEALRRLEQDEKRIEELEKLARWAERAKDILSFYADHLGKYKACDKENVFELREIVTNYPQAEGE